MWIAPLPLVLSILIAPAASSQNSPPRDLDENDVFVAPPAAAPGSPEAQLLEARRALVTGEDERAVTLASAWLDRHDPHPLRAEAFLIRGDATRDGGDEYKALFDYEAVATLYSGSEAYVAALEREFDIARRYGNGLKRKFLGLRWIDASEDAQELFIRIQERLPGSELAEQAGMELSDFYFRRGEMTLAAESYQLFLENYPRSAGARKARLRLIYSRLASFKGPQFDTAGLQEAKTQLESLGDTEPLTAQQIGADALLIRIDESSAAKLLAEARWYVTTRDPIAAERSVRRLLSRYPRSVAAMRGLELGASLLTSLPESVRQDAPDYKGLLAGTVPLPPMPARRSDTPRLPRGLGDAEPAEEGRQP